MELSGAAQIFNRSVTYNTLRYKSILEDEGTQSHDEVVKRDSYLGLHLKNKFIGHF